MTYFFIVQILSTPKIYDYLITRFCCYLLTQYCVIAKIYDYLITRFCVYLLTQYCVKDKRLVLLLCWLVIVLFLYPSHCSVFLFAMLFFLFFSHYASSVFLEASNLHRIFHQDAPNLHSATQLGFEHLVCVF